MILADTGYFIALLDRKDHLHLRAQSWARALREELCVTEWVIRETFNFFSAPVDRAKTHVLLAQIRRNPLCRIIPSSPESVGAALQLHAARGDKEWSLTDCLSFHVMQQNGVTRALAHDHHFEQAGFEALLRREP